MVILVQQCSSPEGVSKLYSPPTFVSPVVPSVIYHHHLHHHVTATAQNVSQIIHQAPSAHSQQPISGSCYISYSYAQPPPPPPPNPFLVFNSPAAESEPFGQVIWNSQWNSTPPLSAPYIITRSKPKSGYIDMVENEKPISVETEKSSPDTSVSPTASSCYGSLSSNSSSTGTTPTSPSSNHSTSSSSNQADPALPVYPATRYISAMSPIRSTFFHAANQPNSSIPLRELYAYLGVHYTLVPWNQSYGMERVWMSEFRRIFANFYNELWSIQPVERKPHGEKLHMFVDSAKVRFCCDRCGHSWTSMKGRIVFWFSLLPPHFDVGIVTIKLFGQKCEMCKVDAYEQPMWYPEEVTKVLMNLFNRVGQIYHGFEKTKFEKQRRLGKPRTPHNKYLCQACLEGICLSRRRSCQEAAEDESNNEDSHSEQSNNEESEENVENTDEDSEDSGIPESEVQNNEKEDPDLIEKPIESTADCTKAEVTIEV